MNYRFHEELPRRLAMWLDGVDEAPTPASTAVAQQRLLARLDAVRSRTGQVRRGWVALASTAVLAVLVVMVSPVMEQGRAFAAVQAHFREFTTLSMHVTQRMGGRVLQQSHVVVDASGTVRTDVGDELSVVVDPVRGRILMLRHGSREAVSMPLEDAGPRPDAALDWLSEIRDFQGRAERVEGTRMIAGQVAHGWELKLADAPLVLWTDPDGLPLKMQMGGAAGLEIQYQFNFDVPLAPGHLSSHVPAGYRLVNADSPEAAEPYR